MELKKLMVDTKSIWIDFPGLENFQIEVSNLSRKELTGLRKRCTSNKFDRKSRQIVENLDEDKFVKEFAKATIQNWKGLTIAHLETLLLIDTDNQDPAAEVEYSEENGEILVNETAPRVHNSGHHTIEANYCSQYDMLLRIILDYPLGNPAPILPSAIVNLIGAEGYSGEVVYEGLDEVLKMENVFVHLYGKTTTKPGRKMGHVNRLITD